MVGEARIGKLKGSLNFSWNYQWIPGYFGQADASDDQQVQQFLLLVASLSSLNRGEPARR